MVIPFFQSVLQGSRSILEAAGNFGQVRHDLAKPEDFLRALSQNDGALRMAIEDVSIFQRHFGEVLGRDDWSEGAKVELLKSVAQYQEIQSKLEDERAYRWVMKTVGRRPRQEVEPLIKPARELNQATAQLNRFYGRNLLRDETLSENALLRKISHGRVSWEPAEYNFFEKHRAFYAAFDKERKKENANIYEYFAGHAHWNKYTTTYPKLLNNIRLIDKLEDAYLKRRLIAPGTDALRPLYGPPSGQGGDKPQVPTYQRHALQVWYVVYTYGFRPYGGRTSSRFDFIE